MLDLTSQGNVVDASSITCFLWHHLLRRLVDGAAVPTEINFRLLGRAICDVFPRVKDPPLGTEFLALCDRVEDLSQKLSGGGLLASRENATLVREIFLDMEKHYLQVLAL